VMERAGGAATDGAAAILDRTPAHLQARSALAFGSPDAMACAEAPPPDGSALFSRRGLFRT